MMGLTLLRKHFMNQMPFPTTPPFMLITLLLAHIRLAAPAVTRPQRALERS